MLLPLLALAEPVDIRQVELRRTDEGLLLSANVQFELPTAVDEALSKGIPMFFVAEAMLLRERWYWYDQEVASTARHLRLSYQPLTRRWRLVAANAPVGNAGLALGQTFDTREEALSAVQRISGWKIAEPGQAQPQREYRVDFRFRLDLSQLPRPFQIGTAGQADWNLSVARNLRLPAEGSR